MSFQQLIPDKNPPNYICGPEVVGGAARWVVVAGEETRLSEIYGPFRTMKAAHKYASETARINAYYVMRIRPAL